MNKKKWKQKFAYRDSRRWLRTSPPFYSALHGDAKDRVEIKTIISEHPAMEAEYRLYKHHQAYHIRRGKRLEDTLEPPRSYRWRGMLAVREAKGITAHRMHHGHTALKLITMMYWPQKGQEAMKLSRAAKELGLTWNRATTLHDGFLRLVEERLRLKAGQVW